MCVSFFLVSSLTILLTCCFSVKTSLFYSILFLRISFYPPYSIVYTTLADKKLRQIESLGISHYPICIAKTQYSFSSDPKAYGVAKDFELKVRDVIINNGAEMIVVVMGEIMRMPGLPKEPQARKIDIVDGMIEGLS